MFSSWCWRQGRMRKFIGREVDKVASEADLIIVCSHENGARVAWFTIGGRRLVTWSFMMDTIHLDPYGIWCGRRFVAVDAHCQYTASGYFKKRIQSVRQYDGWLTHRWTGQEWKIKVRCPGFVPALLWYEGMEAVKSEKVSHCSACTHQPEKQRLWAGERCWLNLAEFGPKFTHGDYPCCWQSLIWIMKKKKWLKPKQNLFVKQVIGHLCAAHQRSGIWCHHA